MTKKQSKRTIHIIAGPTASGKSAKAIELATSLDGVIINCDSMQIYDDLPILSAQPSQEDRESVPHRLYGTRHPNDVSSAGNWREDVIPIIEEVLDNEQTPIITGGSGLYIKALIDGLSPMPDIPADVRAAAVEKQKELGNPAFHALLEKHDPVMAKRFHPFHTARLVRAWEVLQATGKSLAEWQTLERKKPPAHWHFEIHKVMPERAVLRERCDRRFLQMIDMGVLDEVWAFHERIESGEVENHVPLTKALGFQALRNHLLGKAGLEESIEKSQAETRQYAKRQTTWFKTQL